MKQGTIDHPKFKRLAAILSQPLYEIVGLLETLWQLTAMYAEEGDIGRFSNQEIGTWVGWTDEPEKLVQALIDCGWIDQVEDARRLVVHDWIDHCPEHIYKRNSRRRQRQPVAASDGQRQPVADSKVGETEVSSLKTLMTLWNQIPGVAHCREATEKRSIAFAARRKTFGWVPGLPEALGKVAASSFCQGGSESNWVADIDWFLRPDTVTRILEGKYDDRKPGGRRSAQRSVDTPGRTHE